VATGAYACSYEREDGKLRFFTVLDLPPLGLLKMLSGRL